MTCGIYRLIFASTDSTYIGQSVHIEKRYKEHLNNLKSNRASSKLQKAYTLYGTPLLDILLECSIDELDDYEIEAIEIFDSVNNGFNIYSSPNEAPTYTGFGFGNSKYSKAQLLSTVDLLIDKPKLLYPEVADITGVHSSTVYNLANTISHHWLWEEYPEKYLAIKNLSNTRQLLSYKKVSDKLSAKSKGKAYPPIKSPEGIVYIINNAYGFAKDRGLAPNHFQEVLNGRRKSHKGWKLA